ncbi:MAG: hypothetical protein ACRDO7_00455 [Nocardioidaceae bacterium]
MPRATRSAKEAVAWIRNQHRIGSTAWGGMCLSDCRQAWGLPGVYPSAKVAWANAKKKHRFTNEDAIPYGAPVWSDRPGGSTFGHIFLAGGTDKNGRRIFWSNDIGGFGRIVPVSLDAFRTRWGHEILGWAEDLNGYDLNVDGTSKPKPAKPAKKIDHEHVPGWFVVDTAALNGRAHPSTRATITKKKLKGAKVKVTTAVHHDDRLWLRSDKGTWFAAGPTFKAEFLRPRAGERKK